MAVWIRTAIQMLLMSGILWYFNIFYGIWGCLISVKPILAALTLAHPLSCWNSALMQGEPPASHDRWELRIARCSACGCWVEVRGFWNAIEQNQSSIIIISSYFLDMVLRHYIYRPIRQEVLGIWATVWAAVSNILCVQSGDYHPAWSY